MNLREAAQRLVDLFVWQQNEDTGEVEPHLDQHVPHFNDALTALREALSAEPSPQAQARERVVKADQIKHMVQRFLGWKLPENFRPDAGISFKATFNEHMPFGPMKHEPTGTNLFDATQAEAMVRYMIDGLDSLGGPQDG